MRIFRLLLLSFLLMFTSEKILAQRKKETHKVTPESGNAKEAEAQAAKLLAYKAGRDHHRKVQDKETRKRMKKTKKKAERHSWGKDVPWYKRWFRRDKF